MKRPRQNGGARHSELVLRQNKVVNVIPVFFLASVNCTVHSRLFSGAYRINYFRRGLQRIAVSKYIVPEILVLISVATVDPPVRERILQLSGGGFQGARGKIPRK